MALNLQEFENANFDWQISFHHLSSVNGFVCFPQSCCVVCESNCLHKSQFSALNWMLFMAQLEHYNNHDLSILEDLTI